MVWLRRLAVFTVLAVGAALALGTVASEARPRPTVDNPNGDDCFNDPTTDKGVNSAIAYCCYDDGCWICGTTPLPGDACVWDGKYRFIKDRGLWGPLIIGPGPLTIDPGPAIPPRRLPELTPNVGPLLGP